MTRNKVEGHTVFAAEGDKFGNPAKSCGGRAANLVLGGNSLDGARRAFVYFEIIVHSVVGAEEAVEVGLVPNLKKPFFYLGFAIALGNVTNKRFDYLSPLSVIFRRSVIHLPPKNSIVAASKLARHKTKLHHGADTDIEKRIEKNVNVLEIKEKLTVLSAVDYSHFIVEKSVKSYVFKGAFLLNSAKLLVRLVSHDLSCSACADTL